MAGLLVLATACGSDQAAPPAAVADPSPSSVTSAAVSSPAVSSPAVSTPAVSTAPASSAPTGPSSAVPSPTASGESSSGTPAPAVPVPSTAATHVAPPAEATPASSAPIDRDDPIAVVAGPEGGARCSAAAEYADESGDGLDPAVASAWDAARRAATDAGVHLCLADGKRSWDQQVAIAQDYVDKYGAETAKKYALPPESSEHVRGLAIDVQPATAYTWLEARKGSDGFCRTYDNEPWHFEWSAAHITEGCPAMVAHPAG